MEPERAPVAVLKRRGIEPGPPAAVVKRNVRRQVHGRLQKGDEGRIHRNFFDLSMGFKNVLHARHFKHLHREMISGNAKADGETRATASGIFHTTLIKKKFFCKVIECKVKFHL